MSAEPAALAVGLVAALRRGGVDAGTDRAGRFAAALRLVPPASRDRLYWTAFPSGTRPAPPEARPSQSGTAGGEGSSAAGGEPGQPRAVPMPASATERLRTTSFAELTADEVDALALARGIAEAQLREPKKALALVAFIAFIAYLLGRRSGRRNA